MDGVAVFTFFFKLVFYWPFRILFLLGRWLFEKHQERSLENHRREYDQWNAGLEQKAETERKSRSTLYGGSPQLDK
jgi:hypothetical protein